MMLSDKDEAILVDFGVSALVKQDNDIYKGTVGSMRYFAPEVVRTGVKK